MRYLSQYIGLPIAIGLIVASSLPVYAQEESYTSLFTHRGTSNPLFEGWIPSSLVLNRDVFVGPIIDDGIEAWMVDDDSNQSLFVYAALPLQAHVRSGMERGWRLTARMKVIDLPDPNQSSQRTIGGDASPFVLYRDSDRTYQLHFKTTLRGDLYIYLLTNASVDHRSGIAVRIRGGADRYHQYDLLYDPASRAADFFINGRLAYAGYKGAQFVSIPIVMWGVGTTNATGQGNFNAVSFSLIDDVPPPNSLRNVRRP